jgi:hypothetical protein
MKAALHESPILSSRFDFDDASEELVSTDISESSQLTEELEFDIDIPSVSFGNIQVREYERIVGDHPDTRVGVPLTIGWAFVERPPVPIEQYEGNRIRKGNLRLTSITRKNLLHNVFGIPEEEIRNAEKEIQKIKKQRSTSSKQTLAVAQTETALRGISRKIRRGSWKVLKGMAAAAQSGMMLSPGSSLSSVHSML